MNYSHDFHAGNFADVLKHIFLTRILSHLAAKAAPFRYIETHAGSGIYDLSGPEAARTAEWRGGIGQLTAKPLPAPAQDLIEPYLRIVTPFLESDRPRYPGSPAIARALLRREDRMILCELHPRAFQSLKDNLPRDARIKAIEIDGYTGLKAFIPPVERRGLVLIDPPFEDANEFARLGDAIAAAWRKWATGLYLIWYPVKEGGQVASFARDLVRSGVKPILRIELHIEAVKATSSLSRCGLVIVNPPYRLDAEAEIILPNLSRRLALGEPDYLLEWLARA